ncbi:MAG: phosphoribosylamine--glycine ligase [Deltaproteobacteria bacterium]|nr:phosphoribosylamine--glycine ligase [Deltaproteobacteria bacterium]
MRVLVLGSGGREHALCWRLARSPSIDRLYCAPGNPGTGAVAANVGIRVSDTEALLSLAVDEALDLVVVGPEAPLCDGIADRFAAKGIPLVGPTRSAARLEGSKAFAKEFMARHGIPTAAFGVFEDPAEAARYIDGERGARVIKADGLAAGKGVVVAGDAEEAKRAAAAMLGGALGGAGRRIVVEERLEGEELSLIALTDGERIQVLAGCQDHKALLDGDRGPNTGGMGAYSPAPLLRPALLERAIRDVLEPTVRGMAADGAPFRGFLYAGLMIRDDELRVLEFNCRLGDPETQPLMLRMESDLAPHLLGAAAGKLPDEAIVWDPRVAVCVVLASREYPGECRTGLPITGVSEAEGLAQVTVFQAATAEAGGQLVTAGGRVLGVTALGGDVAEARARAYDAASRIHWEGVQYRRDIGWRALGAAPGSGA